MSSHTLPELVQAHLWTKAEYKATPNKGLLAVYVTKDCVYELSYTQADLDQKGRFITDAKELATRMLRKDQQAHYRPGEHRALGALSGYNQAHLGLALVDFMLTHDDANAERQGHELVCGELN